MDCSNGYLLTDCRNLDNSIVFRKIREQAEPILERMNFRFYPEVVIFIVNSENPSEVLIATLLFNLYVFGELVFIVNVEGYKSLDDVVDFFSSNCPSDIKIVDFDKPFPYYYNRTTKSVTIGRYNIIPYIYKFLQRILNTETIHGRVFLEDHAPLKDKDLNKIHLVYEDDEKKVIYDYIFQDNKGEIIEEKEQSSTQNIISIMSSLFKDKSKQYEKIKND